MQRHISPTTNSLSHTHEKGHSKSPFDNNSTQSNLESVLSKFVEKFNDSKASMTQRMSVITPPRNGKLGVIAETPSPGASLTKLNLNASYSKESLTKPLNGNYETLSTPGSSYSISRSTFVTPVSNTPSPLGSYCSPSDQHLKQPEPSPKMVGTPSKLLESHKEKELAVHLDHIYSKTNTDPSTMTLPTGTELSTNPGETPDLPICYAAEAELPAISISPPESTVEVMHFDEDPFSELLEQHTILSHVKHCLSPASSDAGYDSSFSAGSPSSSVWDDTLTELFPSLV